MKSSYKPIGQYVRQSSLRNKDNIADEPQGVNINKEFMPSVANTLGTDLSKYRVVKKNQFAFNPMHVGRDEVLPIAMLSKDDPIIVSPAYVVFKIKDHEELLPEYLMMWMRRSEFDREAWFTTDSSVRGGFSWSDFCAMQLPIPHIDKQREIVKEYHTIVDRIAINNELNRKLEETAQAIYKQWFVELPKTLMNDGKLDDICSLITDGKHGDCQNEENSGYYFISAKDLEDGEINYQNARQIKKYDFEETHRRTQFNTGTILLTNSGTIGRMALGKDLPETEKTTFQKSVAIIKPKINISTSYYLFCLLVDNLFEIIELASGTSQSNLLLGDLRTFPVKYPSYSRIKDFENRISPFFSQKHNLIQQNKKLKLLLNLLLSKMSKVGE